MLRAFLRTEGDAAICAGGSAAVPAKIAVLWRGLNFGRYVYRYLVCFDGREQLSGLQGGHVAT